jgi:hypothetical protein
MKLNYLLPFLLWFGIITLVYLTLPTDVKTDSVSTDVDFNETVTSADLGSGSVVDIIAVIFRFIAFVGFGVGLPSSTPSFFVTFFTVFQTIISVLFVGFIISMFWDG